jgi:hypothetical protein
MKVAQTLRSSTSLFLKNTQKNSGQAILESLLAFIVLCLIFFGLLQVFQIAVADLITDYSAFFAGRAYTVGFSSEENSNDWRRNLVAKAARIRAIPASGKRIFPNSYGDEKNLIKRYLTEHSQWLEFEYWWGANSYNSAFYRPNTLTPKTTFSVTTKSQSVFYMVDTETSFSNYPFAIFDLMDPDRIWFNTAGTQRNEIIGQSSQLNHADDFMEEQ